MQRKCVLGFGVDGFVDGELSTPENLQHIELSYVTNEQCDSAFQEDSYYFLPDIAPSMMCAKGPDALQYGGSCYGDSGGKSHNNTICVAIQNSILGNISKFMVFHHHDLYILFSNTVKILQGPLYDSVNDVVVGVVSWGYPFCNDPAYPSVFGRISTTVR